MSMVEVTTKATMKITCVMSYVGWRSGSNLFQIPYYNANRPIFLATVSI